MIRNTDGDQVKSGNWKRCVAGALLMYGLSLAANCGYNIHKANSVWKKYRDPETGEYSRTTDQMLDEIGDYWKRATNLNPFDYHLAR